MDDFDPVPDLKSSKLGALTYLTKALPVIKYLAGRKACNRASRSVSYACEKQGKTCYQPDRMIADPGLQYNVNCKQSGGRDPSMLFFLFNS